MRVLYVSVGSKVKPRTFGCVAMCSAVDECTMFKGIKRIDHKYFRINARAS